MVAKPATIAVVGAGPAGVAALKNLLDEGFDVTAFERRPQVGGVWTASEHPDHVSSISCTRYQTSKFSCPIADYPVPDDYPLHVTAPLWGAYWRSYVKNTGLDQYIEFNKTATSVRRNEQDTKWLLQFDDEDYPREFDKIVWATGCDTIPKMPKIEGQQRFEGRILHSIAYVDAEEFKDQKVIVFGLGNTAADIAVDVASQASKTYISHRRGAKILPRVNKEGKPLDFSSSWSNTRLAYWLGEYVPKLYSSLTDWAISKMVRAAWGPQDPAWGFEPSPGCEDYSTPVINDELVPMVRDKKIDSVARVKAVIGPKTVLLDNGELIDDVDAIILGTGYNNDFGILNDALTWTVIDPKLPLPNLYQNVFPPEYPDSIACICYPMVPESGGSLRELTAMAVAQVWAGKSPLPDRDAMWAWIYEYQPWLTHGRQKFDSHYKGKLKPYHWLRWVHECAGTGLYESIGWSSTAWKFWWSDRKLYNTCANGVFSPHLYRLIETGKRKAWPGAREAIIKVNEDRAAVLSGQKKRQRENVGGELGLKQPESASSSAPTLPTL
ncbi:putative Flavin monooxygenase-like protein [Seiridium unicorne]|uniref:Flavin monooxygenase-like protein n=1 Tax=Seiridium unicorne TaxID=138068 RepID=A0ABR2UT69_9PEZI